MHMKWQYKTFTIDQFLNSESNLTIEEKLNKYGQDGWELTEVLQKSNTTVGNPSQLDSDTIVFKKQV